MVSLVELRQMRPEDVPRVMEIERECFPVPWRESAYLTELSNRSAYYIVASRNSRIVGYAGMWVIVDEAHITTLGVCRTCRRERIGQQLLNAMLDEAIRRRVKRATLEVRQSNIAAQNLYQKYGFVPAAIRRGYYSDNHENAVVMWVDNMASSEFRSRYAQIKAQLREEARQTPAEGLV